MKQKTKLKKKMKVLSKKLKVIAKITKGLKSPKWSCAKCEELLQVVRNPNLLKSIAVKGPSTANKYSNTSQYKERFRIAKKGQYDRGAKIRPLESMPRYWDKKQKVWVHLIEEEDFPKTKKGIKIATNGRRRNNVQLKRVMDRVHKEGYTLQESWDMEKR